MVFKPNSSLGVFSTTWTRSFYPADAARSGSQQVSGTAGNGPWFPSPGTMCYCLTQQSSNTSCILPRTRRPAACETWVTLTKQGCHVLSLLPGRKGYLLIWYFIQADPSDNQAISVAEKEIAQADENYDTGCKSKKLRGHFPACHGNLFA